MASQSEKKQHHRPHLSPPPVHAATVNNSDVPDLTAAAADKRGAIVFHSCIVVHTLKIDDHYQTKAVVSAPLQGRRPAESSPQPRLPQVQRPQPPRRHHSTAPSSSSCQFQAAAPSGPPSSLPSPTASSSTSSPPVDKIISRRIQVASMHHGQAIRRGHIITKQQACNMVNERRPHHHHTTRPCKQLCPHPATTMKTQETAQHAKGLAFNLQANQPSPESCLPA
uniref:Uncharacterized protein n=1 Tax=Oryza nivara TaxID=4536 RepID=A0A0E0G5W5_ORYNI